MEKGEHLKRQSRPSLLQLRYLKELQTMKKTRGVQRVIAERCEVNASTVNRYFRTCIERGLLLESLEFTEEGEEWLGRYWDIYEKLIQYLEEIGATKEEAETSAEEMVENTDIHILKMILNSYDRQKVVKEKPYRVSPQLKEKLQKCERHRCEFCIYKLSSKNNKKKSRFSMAMHGFEQDAYIVHEADGEYLELRLKDMSAHSRINGMTMIGHLSSLKYEQDGTLNVVEIKDDVVKIPLEACKMHRWQGSENTGSIAITVTCSVGRQHMPESTALLVFWM